MNIELKIFIDNVSTMHNFYKNMELNKMWLHSLGNNGMKFLWHYSFFYFICNNLFLYFTLLSSLSILFSREALIVILDFLVF